MTQGTRRLFVGTFLSDEDKNRIKQARSHFDDVLSSSWNAKLRWVKPEKLHMTWLFIGECNPDEEREIKTSLSLLAKSLPSSHIKFEQIDFFPSKAKRQLMALLPARIDPGVIHIASSIHQELEAFCKKDQKKAYRPHITLFRFARDDQRKFEKPHSLPEKAILPMELRLDRLCLISSHLGAESDEYETLEEYSLVQHT